MLLRSPFLAHLFAIALIASGCRPGADSNTPSANNGNLKTDSAAAAQWLKVSIDPNALKQAEELAKRSENERFQQLFSGLASPFFIDSEMISLLKRNQAESAERLRSLLPQASVNDEGVGAALLLCKLQDELGRAFASRALKTGTPQQRLRLLDDLDAAIYSDPEQEEYQKFLFSDNTLTAALLQQLDDADSKIVAAAIQCCGYLNVPGYHEHFLKLLKRDRIPDRDRILFWLSKGELIPELFEYAVQNTEPSASGRTPDTSVFEAFARRSTEPLRSRAQDRLQEIIRASPDKGQMGYDGNRLGILRTLAETADAADLPWLKQLAESESGLYATDLLTAWIRLEPETGRATLFQWLDTEDRRQTAIGAAEDAFRKTADPQAIERLSKLAETVQGRQLRAVCAALRSIAGKSAQETIEHVGSRLDADDLAQFRQSFDPQSLTEILEAVHTAGILDDEELMATRQELASRKPESGEVENSLFGVLSHAKRGISFDAETGMLPCRHDLLVRDLAAITHGLLAPTAIHEIWQQKNQDDDEAPYTLQFVANNRLYQGELRNLGDWGCSR